MKLSMNTGMVEDYMLQNSPRLEEESVALPPISSSFFIQSDTGMKQHFHHNLANNSFFVVSSWFHIEDEVYPDAFFYSDEIRGLLILSLPLNIKKSFFFLENVTSNATQKVLRSVGWFHGF